MMHCLRPFLAVATLAAALAACGKSEEEPLEPAPVAELRGPWLMVNRAPDCAHDYTLIAPTGFYRVYEDKRPRKPYFAISKFVLEPGKVTLETAGMTIGRASIAALVFSMADGKLRLEDIRGPSVASYKSPPDTLAPENKAYLDNVLRLARDHFAMDRCTG